tara:strand:- start:1168 stop:1341 length:174 start_codon:yes stop_codon:yes gene_type:complete
MDTFPHVFDETRQIWLNYEVTSQPAWVFIDGQGEEERIIGRLDFQDLQTKLTVLQQS